MPSTLRDRVLMTVSGTPGTGNVTLGSASSGYQSAASAGVQDGETNTWVFVDGSAWEISSCVYTASGTSLARTLISSSTGSLLSLTSAATAFVTASSNDIVSMAAFLMAQCGSGADGDATITGALTLTGDKNYRNLTLGPGCAIITSGYRIYVSGLLDLTAAPAGAISRNGTAGRTPVNNISAAAGVTSQSSGNVGGGAGTSTPGNPGQVGIGSAGSAGGWAAICMGGGGGGAGASGAGSTGSGQPATSNASSVTLPPPPVAPYLSVVQYTTVTGFYGGNGGASAPSGGGDGTNRGSASGSPGSGGGNIFIRAAMIVRGAGTAPSCVQALGGVPGAGFQAIVGNVGGAGGSGGGGGGYVDIACGVLLGAPAVGAVDVSGSNGADGTNGLGTGIGGDGGNSGYGGQYRLSVFSTGAQTIVGGVPPVTGTAHSGISGGAGAVATVARYDL